MSDPGALRVISNCSQLTSLEVELQKEASKQDSVLAALVGLERLVIGSKEEISQSEYLWVPKLTNLRALQLNGMTEHGQDFFKPLTKLEKACVYFLELNLIANAVSVRTNKSWAITRTVSFC
jgi:hypothetical protein